MTSRRSAVALLFGMVSAAVAGEWARPTIKVSDERPAVDLENMIPREFGDWSIDRNMPVIVPPPDQQEALNKIYNQILARTYVNSTGYRIMLSLAYGGDQSDGLSVHLPEVCYVGQGFKLEFANDSLIEIDRQKIPIRRLVTTLGPRSEPITYWVTFGEEATISAWRRRVIGIKYGLRRRVPDGMLVRVSSIDKNEVHAYQKHDEFLSALVAEMTPHNRGLLIGSATMVHS